MRAFAGFMARGMVLMLLASTATAETTAANSFSATLEHRLAKADTLQLGDIKWSCNGQRCRGRGTSSDVEASCRALATRLGPVKTFIATGVALKECRTVAGDKATPKQPAAGKASVNTAPAHAGNLAAPKPPLPESATGVTVTTGKLSYILVNR